MKGQKLINTYNKAASYPCGKKLFSWYAAGKAPYFNSIKPILEKLETNHCQVFVKKRKRVQNHIGTMHVIAIANGLEMAMGFMAEASIPKYLRWIPKSMNLEYPSKGTTDIICTAKVEPKDWQIGNMEVPVVATDTNGQIIVQGSIHLWITEKPTNNI